MPLAIWNVSADTAILAAVAALAAFIAAGTAQIRLRAQLHHDSRMRERDATRDALDAVVNEINGAAGAMNVAADAFRELFQVRAASLKTGQDHGIAKAEDEARPTVQALAEHRVPLMAASFRLHLRFADKDPIIGRLAEWRCTFEQLVEDYEAALESSEFEMKQRFEATGQTATRLGEQLNSFLTVARAWSSDAATA
ncbi:MAG TPA: hypothetical protein VNP96_06130 [Solirubrobacterales bacterium]|nr:hypothetical protein [Solirubrobacterales bacterium]